MLLCFFFFKQKTAYEMRISDWSSDVCSSDLGVVDVDGPEKADPIVAERDRRLVNALPDAPLDHHRRGGRHEPHQQGAVRDAPAVAGAAHILLVHVRSEERRVGKECVSTCRSRWSLYH